MRFLIAFSGEDDKWKLKTSTTIFTDSAIPPGILLHGMTRIPPTSLSPGIQVSRSIIVSIWILFSGR